MAYDLQFLKEDTLAVDKAQLSTTATLSLGNFGSPSGIQILAIDYKIPAKAAYYSCSISGTAVTGITYLGGAATDHSANASVGMVFTPTHWDKIRDGSLVTAGTFPAGLLGSAVSLTSNFSTSSTTAVQVTGATKTVTVPAGGRAVRISFFASAFTNTAAAFNTVSIWDGTVGSGTLLATSAPYNTTLTGATPVYVSFVHVPSAGSKTYNVSAHVSAGTGQLLASSTAPMQLTVEGL